MTLKLVGHIGTIAATSGRETRCPHGAHTHRSYKDDTGTFVCVENGFDPIPFDHSPGSHGPNFGVTDQQRLGAIDVGSEDDELKKAEAEFLTNQE